MLNNEKTIKRTNPGEVIKKAALTIKESYFFWYCFIAILVKSILFIALISDDKANGIVPMRVFYSMPPFLVYFSFICIVLSFGFLFRNKGQTIGFLVINMLVSVLYIGDIWYFRSNSSFLSLHMFSMTSNLDNLSSSVISMIRIVDIVFVIDIILQVVLMVKRRSKAKYHRMSVTAFLLLLIIPTLYLTYAHYKIDKYDRGFTNQMIFRKSWSPNQTMSNLTPLGYHIFDSYNFYVESKPYVISSSEKKNIQKWFDDKKENLPDNQYKGMFKGKNLLVVQWESLENFVINQKVEGQEITPTLNKLLSNSIYFNNFYEQTYNGTSSDGELVTETSVFPVREGATFFRYPNNTYQYSLPNVMKSLGYNTFASHPDKGSYWNWMPALRSIGFEKAIDSTNYNIDEVINLGISDKSYLKQLPDKIKALKSPFYAYTVTLTSHAPFDIPDKYREIKLPKELEGTKLGGYFQSIQYTDKYIGQMLEQLDKSGVLDNTVVVFYGDHEGVHKFYDDEIKNISYKGDWWKENDRRVPLIIYSKGQNGKTISTFGGQCDTLPTLAYLFGADVNQMEDKIFGRNLLNTKKDYTVLSTRQFLGTESYPGEKERMLESIDLGDKLIRANYFKK
ncbi:LTA synthase family protein [Clostridium sp. C8-1-8]|uniref:LTA synthase family protein n=1 Tax=Clostridium sp. C8-1-8 TaxID=2698831 RepID=UPI00136A00FE|nr:LTA synthase family protein [Clostridium sp. C8-1-8]